MSAPMNSGEAAPKVSSGKSKGVPISVEPWRKRCFWLGLVCLLLWLLLQDFDTKFSAGTPFQKWLEPIEPYTSHRFSPDAGFTFNDLVFLDEKIGIGVGDNGTLLRTDDGGRKWLPVAAINWVRTGQLTAPEAIPANAPQAPTAPKAPANPRLQPPPANEGAKGATNAQPRRYQEPVAKWEGQEGLIRVAMAPEQSVEQKPSNPPYFPEQKILNIAPPPPARIETALEGPAFADGPLPPTLMLFHVKHAGKAGIVWAIGALRDQGALGATVFCFSKDAGQSWTGIYLPQFPSIYATNLAIDGATGDAWAFLPTKSALLVKAGEQGKVAAYPAPFDVSGLVADSESGSLFCFGAINAEDGTADLGALAGITDLGTIENLQRIAGKRIVAFDPGSSLLLDLDGAILSRTTNAGIRYLARLPEQTDELTSSAPETVFAWKPLRTFKSTDRGQTWSAIPELANLTRLHFNQRIGWALNRHFGSERGNDVLVSRDGGESWNDPRKFTRFPSPLSTLLFLLGIGLIAPAFFHKPPPLKDDQHQQSIANFYLSDAPLQDFSSASGDMSALASGIARFLRNENTGAPLVLGVCGPWGSGKSSLMNLVRTELSTHGFQPVWFNAWHHEQEQHLLAALLQNIRDQAIPPVFSWQGVFYRIDLARQRFRRRWVFVALMVSLTALLLGFAFGGGITPDRLDYRDATAFFSSLAGLLPLGAAAAPLLALVRLLGAFGIDPGKLAISATSGAKTSDLHDLTSFRYRFAVEFDEVTRALKPKPMVIFIDDLDRCQPDHMMSVLETINFLASSGECFIVLSMEKRAVLACLAQKLTGWTQQYKLAFPDTDEAPTPAAYAALWLEKLVQVEVNAPVMTRPEMQKIAGAAGGERVTTEAPMGWSRFWSMENLAPISVLVFIVLLGCWGAWFAYDRGARASAAKERAQDKPAQTWFARGSIKDDGDTFEFLATDRAPAPLASAKPVPPAASIPVNPYDPVSPVIDPGPTPGPQAIGTKHVSVSPPARTFAHLVTLGLGLLIALPLVVLARKRLRRLYEGVVTDSTEFRNAVTAWWTVIEQRNRTPRGIKRFINRLRLYASLVRRIDDPEGQPLVSESTIVGFGVLEEVCPHVLRRDMHLSDEHPNADDEWNTLGALETEARKVITNLNNAEAADAVRRLTTALRA